MGGVFVTLHHDVDVAVVIEVVIATVVHHHVVVVVGIGKECEQRSRSTQDGLLRSKGRYSLENLPWHFCIVTVVDIAITGNNISVLVLDGVHHVVIDQAGVVVRRGEGEFWRGELINGLMIVTMTTAGSDDGGMMAK